MEHTNQQPTGPSSLRTDGESAPSDTSNCTKSNGTQRAATQESSSPTLLSQFSFFNVQGIAPQTQLSKVDFIKDHLEEGKKLFIGLSETWIYNHLDAELNIEGYTLYRADSKREKRKHGRFGGGTAMYIRDDIAASSQQILNFSNKVVEVVCTYSEKENLLLATLYRQPDDSSHGRASKNKEFEAALNSLSKAISTVDGTPDIIIGGDFNCPHMNWKSWTPNQGCPKDEKEMLQTLIDFNSQLLLTQIIMEPTHYQGNLLDIVLTNNTSLIHSHTVLPVPGSLSHHSMITLQTERVQSSEQTANRRFSSAISAGQLQFSQ